MVALNRSVVHGFALCSESREVTDSYSVRPTATQTKPQDHRRENDRGNGSQTLLQGGRGWREVPMLPARYAQAITQEREKNPQARGSSEVDTCTSTSRDDLLVGAGSPPLEIYVDELTSGRL